MDVISRTVPYYHTIGFILGRKAEKGIIGLHISETRQTCCYQNEHNCKRDPTYSEYR